MLKHLCISGGAVVALAVTALIGGGCSKSSSTGPSTGVGGIITVTGKVIGQNLQAVANIPVIIPGKPSTNTDAGGNFSIAGVTTPYDISVVDATNKVALVYKGLTRLDPTLMFIGSTPGTGYAGTVSGKISGGTFTPNQGASDITSVVFASPEVLRSANTAASGTFGPISLTWFGPTVTTGSLYAVQFTADAGGLPVASGYKGYGVRTGIAVNDGGTMTNQFDTLQTVTTNQFTGTVTVPPGYSLTSKRVYARVSQSAVIVLFSENNAITNLSYFTPGISGATLLLGVVASKPGGASGVYWKNGLATSATGVSVNIVAPPELSLPVNNATAVDTTVTFAWSAMTGGVHLVIFQGSGSTPSYYVLTSGTSATIPNMKPFGFGLPASTEYIWYVLGFGPFASVDDAAGSAGFLVTTQVTVPVAATGDTYFGSSTFRGFTTAP